MSKEGDQQHLEFLQGYLQRQHVQEYFKLHDRARRIHYVNIPIVKGTIVFVGRIIDYVQMLAEAEDHAKFKGYTFK